MSAVARLKERIRGILSGASPADRIRRRRKLLGNLHRRLPGLQLALLAAGYIWILALPFSRLGRKTYHDENALQPSQVTTTWNWADVHRADRYLEQLEALYARNASSYERAQYLSSELKRVGLPAYEQNYTYAIPTVLNGTNVYAVSPSPRASGTEAIVISASWVSRTGEGDGTPNLRGISTVLSLAALLKGQSHWAKDLVFVVSDGYLDGMHAFLSVYHGKQQPNLRAEPLALSPGVIWTAFNIDYACHSFSHLGVFIEGLNGRLPNQDLFNAFHTISRHTGGVPVVLYDHLDDSKQQLLPIWLPQIIRDNAEVQEYAYRARNILRHFGYQATGKASGVHGLFHQFRIDAFTIYAVSASGPHGFHALGRVMESTLRTANNLLERLHASFFFYILTTPGNFLTFGSFLPSVLLISISLMIGGLRQYVDAGWTKDASSPLGPTKQSTNVVTSVKWVRQRRPVLPVIVTMLWCHIAGALLFYVAPMLPAWGTWLAVVGTASTSASVPQLFTLTKNPGSAPVWAVLNAFNLCLASTVISVTSLLNFSLAAALAVALGALLSLPPRASTFSQNLFIIPVAWFIAGSVPKEMLWDWTILGVWAAPFTYIIFLPLCLQAAVVRLMKE